MNKKISVTAKSTAATAFLVEVALLAEVPILVDEKITFHKAVSIDFKDAPLKTVLDHFAKAQGVAWKLSKNHIKISKK